MGQYCEWDDVHNRYKAIAKIGDAAEVESAYIYYAENELNSLLGDRFSIPFSSNNITAKDLSIELTYIRMGICKLEDAKQKREMLMAKIDRLRNGTESMLNDDGTTLTTVGDTVWCSDSEYHHTFGHGRIEDFHVDSSQVYSEEEERLY
jgi:hypothetical protein